MVITVLLRVLDPLGNPSPSLYEASYWSTVSGAPPVGREELMKEALNRRVGKTGQEDESLLGDQESSYILPVIEQRNLKCKSSSLAIKWNCRVTRARGGGVAGAECSFSDLNKFNNSMLSLLF